MVSLVHRFFIFVLNTSLMSCYKITIPINNLLGPSLFPTSPPPIFFFHTSLIMSILVFEKTLASMVVLRRPLHDWKCRTKWSKARDESPQLEDLVAKQSKVHINISATSTFTCVYICHEETLRVKPTSHKQQHGLFRTYRAECSFKKKHNTFKIYAAEKHKVDKDGYSSIIKTL